MEMAVIGLDVKKNPEAMQLAEFNFQLYIYFSFKITQSIKHRIGFNLLQLESSLRVWCYLFGP